MTHSTTIYANTTVSLEGTGPQAAGFGNMMLAASHSITANRLDGPYLSRAEMVTAGFTSTATPEIYAWATAVFAQTPRVKQVYIGRRDGGDASLTASLDAILAANPGAWYGVNIDTRTASDILLLNSWLSATTKIGVAQCNDPSILSGAGPEWTATFGGTAADGNYVTTFDGYGLSSPVPVTTTRAAGTPATDDDLATQHAADITTLIASSLAGVVTSATAVGDEVVVQIADGIGTGTFVSSNAPGGATLVVELTDADLATQLFDLNGVRMPLIYDPSDTQRLDGAWMSRCLSFNLDQKKGIWAYKPLIDITGANLTSAEVAQLRNTNTNYFSPAVTPSGTTIQAFTAQGYTASGAAQAGRRIDITTTLDFAKARFDEALLDVLLRETHGVPLDDGGVNRFLAAANRVLGVLVAARHLVPTVVPAGEDYEGLQTPAILPPTIDTANRTVSLTILAYLGSFAEKVELGVEIRL